MTNIQKLEVLLNLARQAHAPAETHEHAMAAAKEIARFIQDAETAQPAPDGIE